MERLLADATKLTGVKYDINNLADVYNAIHAIQENLDITGTTAKEASETFSGSFAMMKASAQNLMGYMADGSSQEYITKAASDLVSSTSTFLFGNALPMLGRFVTAIPGVISEGLNTLADGLRTAGESGIGSFIEGLISQIPALVSSMGNFVGAIVDYVRNHKQEFVDAAHQCVEAFVEGLAEIVPMSEKTVEGLPKAIETAVKAFAGLKVMSTLTGPASKLAGAIKTLGGGFSAAKGNVKTFFDLMKSGGSPMSNLALMLSQGEGALAGLGASFVNAGGGASGFLAVLKTVGSGLVSAIFSPVTLIIATIGGLVAAFMHLWNTSDDFRISMTDTWNSLVDSISGFCDGIVERINDLGFEFENISEVISAIWDGLCNILAPVFEGAWSAIVSVIQGALDVITGLLDFFIGLFTGNWSQLWTGCQEIASGLWTAIWGLLEGLWNGLLGAFDAILALFGTSWSEIWTSVSTFASSIWNSICSTLSGLWNGMLSTATSIFNSIKSAISDAMQSAIDFIVNIWSGVAGTLSGIWNGIVSTAQSIFSGIYNAIVGPFQRAKETVEGIWNWLTGHSSVDVTVNQSVPGGARTINSMHAAGGVFTQATLIPSIYGGNHIVGEAGPEAILPLREFYASLDKSIQAGYQQSGNVSNEQLDTIIDLLTIIATTDKPVMLDRKTVGALLTDEIYRRIQSKELLRARLRGEIG